MDISVGVMLSKKYTNLYMYNVSNYKRAESNRTTEAHMVWMPLSKFYPPNKSEDINIILAIQFVIDMGLAITDDPKCKNRIVKYLSVQDIQKWIDKAIKNIKIAVRATRPGEVLTLYPSNDLKCVNFDIYTPTESIGLNRLKTLVPERDTDINHDTFDRALNWITNMWVDKVPICLTFVAREE